ncbi:nucleotide pyrophosphohydrolase [Vibrio tubiashii ATCC 19109]|uniref:Nucleotide pyrophosphohydrolase n=1 Tax=Vibrio tubiashii ATCC 19109 TaxID=1051646 RepID=F9T4F7_9VIBR|nr:hypothetical protein [Vibrio tubiashii]AIW13317.1 nucleotide pyrophosphohydrolase [Vibrio tubiashii ATCC 19109]EGU56068.1 hypothetical protein VITU9109_08907 [Vibrio tubiashii ATCC 19109]EIF04280.1 hypothetical protein VT1337_09122 [Vibrio tubiashii NCIMB 1337 = ATCC 19106]
MNQCVYLAGSFKEYDKLKAVYAQLMEAGIVTTISEPLQSNGIDGCLTRIKQADILYVLNYDGYVGKSVAMDIGYALGLSKMVYALEPITDPDITHLLDGVLSPSSLISLLSE